MASVILEQLWRQVLSASVHQSNFTWTGVSTLRVRGVIQHAIGAINAEEGQMPLCLQAYFVQRVDEDFNDYTPSDRYLLSEIVSSIWSNFYLHHMRRMLSVGFWLGFPLKPAPYCNLHFHSPKGILLCTNPLVLFY